MQLLADFLPIIAFFIIFKFYGVYAATAVAIITSVVQVLFYRIKHGKFESLQLLSLGIIVVMGGATLLLHNELFIKWKVTVIDWVFASIILITQGTSKPALKRLLGQKIKLPDSVWKNINLSWAIFFISLGTLNLYIAYHFSTSIWVNFKLFGTLGATIVFIIGQAIFLSKYLKDEDK